MIALDTNVVVRLLVEDDRSQVERARALLEAAAEREDRCHIVDAVLCETGWVLQSVYGARRAEIVGAMQRLLSNPAFVFDDRRSVLRALDLYQRGKGDLSDYLIALRGRSAGATTTHTFDLDLRGSEAHTLL